VIAVEPDGLSCDGRTVPKGEVLGFEEHYDPWTGRAWLRVRGPDHEEPIAAGYGELRARLREAFPDRPFDADWNDGEFPAMPMGVPEPWLRLSGGALALGSAAGLALWMPVAAVPLAVVLGWAWMGAWGRVRLSRMGLHIGAGWTPRLGWHEVEAVHLQAHGRWARVVVKGRGHLAEGTVPAVLVPALRAKVWRFGGLGLDEGLDPIDHAYARWAPRLMGLAGAVAVVGGVWALEQPTPWAAWGSALLATLGFALLAAAAEARSSGWATGAVLALTGLYGLGLVVLQLWLGSGIGLGEW
jgi:hypothetical protein